MPAPRGNQFAAKPEHEKVSESLFVRMTASEKAICAAAAGDKSLSNWARNALLGNALREQGGDDQSPTRTEDDA